MAKLSVQERLERLREAGRKQSGQGGQQSSPAPAATSGRTTAGMTVRERLNRLKEAGRQQSPSLPTVTSQAAGETAGRKKAGRPTTAGKPGKITSPAREAERRAEELRTLRDEAQQEFLNFRGAEITAGAAGMPTESYAGQRYRTAEEAYRARQDYDRQLAELRNRYYQEENEQQRARLAEDASMQASFARADEIRGALNRIQTLEQTRVAAPGPVTEDAVNQAVREIAGQYGLSREDSRNLTTVRKALEAQLLEETDRISAAGYDYERMTEYQKRQERAAEAERQRQQTEAWADEHPVLASLASVGASALQAVDIPRLIATGGGSEDDLRTYTPADPNAAIISNFVTGVRDTVSKKIADNTDWELFGQNVASFLYNTGMSIGDSASQVALLGPWATYLMGASAASQQAVNVLERGGSNSQAFWGGLAAGAAEAVFERFSIEKLLEAKTINSVKDLLRATAQQAGTEASEEMLTEIANILSDTAIMGESSDFEQLVTQYQLMGMDEDEARKQAYLDSVAQVVWAGVGGALSGMAMGGATSGVDLAGRNIRQGIRDYQARPADSAYDVMREKGMFSPEAREAVQAAERRRGVTEAVDRAAWMMDPWNRRSRREYLKNRGRGQDAEEAPPASQQAQSPQATQAVPAGTQTAAPEGAAQVQQDQAQPAGRQTQATPAADPVIQTLESGGRVDQATLSDEQFAALAERGDMDVDAGGRVYQVDPAQHIDQRSSEDMGDRRINAFQFDHPEVHRYYSEAAAELLNELSVTEKGGQTLRLGDYQTGYEYRRTKRAAPERITVLLDDYGLSYDQIEKALDAIIHNHGQENIAAAKRVEFVLDDMLTNGYQSMDGYIPPNQDYINAKASIAGYVETAEGGSGYLDGIDEAPVTAERMEQNGQQGAEPGDGVSDGDLGRLSGTGAGEQTGGVETGAERGRGPADTYRAARERQNSVHDLRGEPVSSQDLGLPRGTDAKTLQVIPESAWDDGLRATADRVREETGLDTVFVTGGIQIGTPDGARLVRGVFTGDRIIVQADNIRVTPDQIADHEIFHDRAAQTPGLIRELEDRVREQYGPEDLGRVVEQYIRKLRGVISVTENAGEDGTQAEAWAILEEIFADAYAGINAFSVHAERFNETVEQTMTERGVGRGSQNAAATDRTTGPPAEGRYSFGGENARRADLDALDRAKEMERQGVAMETIFRETGWYTGADGKWRFEIDDSGMEYSRWGDLNRSDRAEYARFRELEGKFIDGTITQEEQTELRQLLDQGHGPGRAEEQQTLRLADFLRHDELYQNYPQLRQAALRFADLPEGTHGSYNTGTNTITLNNSLRDAPEDTLVHEIQHAIQSAEGFSGGSSPEYWARREYETGDLVSNRLQQEYDQILNGLGREDQNKYIRYTELERELERLFLADSNTEAGRRYDRLEAEQDAIYEELYPNAWFRQLLDLSHRMEDTAGEYRRMYENTAGEIEARDVTARRQLTPEQRRQTMPNTGDENTVFSDSDAFFSAETDTDALKERQMQIIQETNPADDDYHTWIRSAEEIKTFRESIEDPEWAEYDEYNPDFTRAMAEEALESGEIEVFSSYPIEAGGFVSPSRMEAESYSGNGRVYSKTVPLTDVAWIDPTQGQYAPVDRTMYSMSEPTDAQQDEAERLLFQGVDADTIREMTGLERTEDHGWRFTVDTTPEAAYDGGRTTDQQGGLDDGQNEYDLRGVQGENVRRREAGETIPGRLGSAQRRNAASSQTDEGRGRTAPASWARGRVIDQPSIAAGIAVENAGRYGADAFVVEDAAIKEKNPNAWALTSGGSVYISDSVPEELAGVVGYHEAVHAARQQGQAQYRDFLENTGDYIDFTSNQSAEIMDMILGRRFPGRESLLDLTQREQDIAFDELNALVWGYHKADPENARAQFADMFQDYDAYIADLDAAMESGAEPEIPGLSLPTLDDEDIRYSMDEDSAAAPDDSANQTEQSREESAVAALPPRAQNYLKSVERKLLRKMGNSLSVPRWARREFLAPIVRDISEAYLVEGRVPAETMDNLFDEAYEQGVVAAREYYDEYKELRDYLRNTKLEVSQEDAAGIPDFNDFRKSNFGRLNISTKSGKTNVDQVYQELSARWPEFFNEDRENNIPDQLERIAEVSKSFRIVEQTLDEYYGDRAADFRQYAKHDFEAAVTDLLGELRNVKRYADASRQPAEAADQAPATLEEVNALWTDLKEARRTYEKAEARNLLTDSDEAQVGRLLRGEIEPRHLNPERDNVRGITEVYQAKREYERITGLLRLWNQSRKAEMRSQAEHLLETANAWKDKKSGILYARETMERNIRDIVPDRQLAEQIIETYFKPVHRAAADSNRLKNRYRDQVRGMHLSRKVAKGNTVSEAHAVQLLGEAEDNIRMIQQSRGRRKVRDGKTLEEWQAVIRDLWETSPHLDQGKIRNAVQTFRTIYDELFQQMNDARVRNGYEPVNYRQGYFPHFQPGDGDGILATFGRALGISTEVTALPTTINGLTHAFRPGIQWFGNAQERLGFNTAYDAVEGFDRYIEGVADVIYQTDNIQRLRTLATEIRYRTGDEEIRRQIDRVRDDPGKNDEEKRKAIEEITEKGRFALSNFVVELDEYTNLLANKKSFSDRNMERNVGRTRLYNLARWLEGRVAANMVAVNPASWLTNFIPLTQGGALLDRGMLLRGMWDTLWSYKESDGIAERSSFLVNRRGSDPLVQTWGQKASVVMSRPMSYIDTFTADSLVRARYRQNLKRGMSEDAAMADADAFAANVMADRSKGATPTLFNRRNPMTKLFTQFQLEVNNQLSYVFKDIPREKRRAGLGALAAALFKFVLGAWLYDEVYEFLIGRRPALDPIGILNDTVGDLTGWEVPNLVELGVGAVIGDAPSWQVEEAGLYETAGNLGTALAEELPFIGGLLGGGRLPIGSAIPDFGTLRRAAMDNEWAPEKRLKEAADELAKPAAYLALPFGGGQIKRVFEAIDAVRRGGVYTLDAEGEEQLQYPVYNDTFWEAVANGLRAAVFGRTSLPTGREWVESGFDTLSAKQTAAYKGMVDVGVPGEEAYSLVQELQGLKAAEQRKTLRSADISGDGKSVVYYAMMASDDEMALMDALAGQNADMGEVTRVLMEMKDEARKEENKRSTVDILSGASRTDGQKAEIFRSTGSDSLEEKLSVAEEYGISGGEWMEAEEGFAQEREEAEAKSLTQEIAEAVIRNMDGLDRQERAAMWQLQNKGWNWKSNPFDRKVGREIYDQQHAEDED